MENEKKKGGIIKKMLITLILIILIFLGICAYKILPNYMENENSRSYSNYKFYRCN